MKRTSYNLIKNISTTLLSESTIKDTRDGMMANMSQCKANTTRDINNVATVYKVNNDSTLTALNTLKAHIVQLNTISLRAVASSEQYIVWRY